MKDTISRAGTPVAQYLDKYSLPGYMWDEVGEALIDPSIITGQRQLYMDIDIDHGASYGKTIIVWDSKAHVPPYLRLANVQFDIDAEKFYQASTSI